MKLVVVLSICIAYSAAFAAIPASARGRPGSSLQGYQNHVDKKTRPTTELKSVAVTAETAPPARKGGEASVMSSTFNIAKSVIGAGVLSLPSGVAAFADEPAALIPAAAMTAAMGLVAAYSYSLIGKACDQHDTDSFEDVWSKSVNPQTGKIISGGITANCFFASLAYSIIIADSFTSLAQSFSLPGEICQRVNCLK
jgi:hypothetical protein